MPEPAFVKELRSGVSRLTRLVRQNIFVSRLRQSRPDARAQGKGPAQGCL
jgi:hypothetical protein